MEDSPARPYDKLESVAPGNPEVAGSFLVEGIRGINMAISALADDEDFMRELCQTRRTRPARGNR